MTSTLLWKYGCQYTQNFGHHFCLSFPILSSKHRDISAGVANTSISAILETKTRDAPVDPPNNVSRFELHEVAVDDDHTKGLDPKATAAFSLHLGDLFVVAEVPSLNFSIWYDADNSDAWGM